MTAAAPWSRLWHDYATFHRAAVETGDVDPVYPVMRHLGADLSAGQAAWLALLHVAYYDLGSALVAYELSAGEPATVEPMMRLPCGTERRGHRNPPLLRAHLDAVTVRARAHGNAAAWLEHLATGPAGDTLSYRRLDDQIRTVYGYGRWAAYKVCELLGHVLQPYDPRWATVIPDDMGHAHSTGPRQGLSLIAPAVPVGNSRAAVAALDALSTRLVADLNAAGAPATIPTVETSLCDFHALHAGRYYVGHDIDQMAAQLHRAQQHHPESTMLAAAWTARAATLPRSYLGELDHPPRFGIEPGRRLLYRTSGRIVER